MKIIDLHGKWLFTTNPKTKNWEEMKVPSNWEVAGLKDYSGDVWFKKELPKIDVADDEDVILEFKGVDYFADVWLSGNYLGHHEGYFQPFSFDITKVIHRNAIAKQNNVLVVKVSAPAEKTGRKAWPHLKSQIKGVFGHHDVRPGSWSEKRGQSHGTGGIWNDVSMLVCPKVRVSGVKVSPKLSKDHKSAKVLFEVFVENTGKTTVYQDLGIGLSEHGKQRTEQRTRSKIKISKGLNVYHITQEIKKPKLWWTWDHGAQPLYNVKIYIHGSLIEQRFGIREIKIDGQKRWFLNGRKIFIRGSNIIPEEYLSTYSSARIKKDVELIRSANINTIRMHAHINRKELYDAFDEAGILVWQDFALQWEYVDTKEFIAGACSQIRDMVNLLHNNVCVGVWCCHNEPVKTGEKIDDLLLKAAKEEDSTRAIFKSSDFYEHPYPGWFWGHYRYFFSTPGKPFPSEFGAQALPGALTLKKMFSKKDLWPPNWQEWAYRDFVYEQTFHIAGVKKGSSLNEFIKNSQNYQAELIKFAVENYRLRKWSQINGLFHFMFLEPWAAISYSVLDYFRKPKKGFYTLQRVFQPLLIISSLQRKTYGVGRKIEGQFWVVNDLNKGFMGVRVSATLRYKNRKIYKFPSFNIDIERGCCKEVTNIVYSKTKGLKVPQAGCVGGCELIFSVFDRNGCLLSSNTEEIDLEKIPAGIKDFNAEFFWE